MEGQVLLLESLVEVFGQEVGHVVEEVGGRVSVSGCRVWGGSEKIFFWDRAENGACCRKGAHKRPVGRGNDMDIVCIMPCYIRLKLQRACSQ